MVRSSKEPKLTLRTVVTDLRETGYRPNYDAEGKLVDWRRIRGHNLITAKVTVHTSGRITIHHRSTANGKGGSKSNRRESATA